MPEGAQWVDTPASRTYSVNPKACNSCSSMNGLHQKVNHDEHDGIENGRYTYADTSRTGSNTTDGKIPEWIQSTLAVSTIILLYHQVNFYRSGKILPLD